MLESVKLTRFKQFRETEIELRPFTVLTGENNSGKTTVLQAVWLALHSLNQGRLLSVDRRTLQTKVSSTGYYMFDVPFAPQEDLTGLFYKKVSRGSATYDENSGALVEVVDERGNRIRMHMRELFKNLNVKLLTPEKELNNPEIQKFAPLYFSGFAGLRLQEERIFPAVLESRIAAGEVSANVRNIVLDLKLYAPEKYRYLVQLLEEEFDFCIREVHYHESSERHVFTEYEEMAGGETVHLEFGSCGSGMLQILQTIAVILRYCPEKSRVVLIDEPEAHLHPRLQRQFSDILRQLQERLDIQIILATHAEAIIREAKAEEIITVSAKERANRAAGSTAPAPEEEPQRRPEYEQMSLF